MGHARKQMLTIYVSSICSLKCKYCALSSGRLNVNKEDLVIDLDFAFKGIDDFFRDYPSRGVRFYSSGEVTTQMDTFKKITQYIKGKNEKNTYLELQTNGYFKEDYAAWIEDNMDFIWVSFDGLPEFQDANRPTVSGKASSDVIIKNIEKFSNSCKVDIGIRVTLTPNMIDRQKEIIDFLNGFSIKYISVERAYSSVNNQLFTEESTDPIYFAKRYIEAYYYASSKGIFYNHFNMVNFDEPCRFFCRSCIPYPHLTTDGYVTCCDMAPYGKEIYREYTLPALVYGKYEREKNRIIYDENQIYQIRQKNVENLSQTVCKGCNIIENCVGGCLGQSYNNTGEIVSKCEWDCAVTKYLAQYLPLNKELYPILHP